jgi:hypothetical protein
MIMNFPEWAPPKLVEHYQYLFNKPETNWYRALSRETLIALISNPEMKSVWKMLYQKRVSNGYDERQPASFCSGVMAYFLFQVILSSIVETKRKITIRSEDVLKYQEIAKAARELAEMVSGSGLDVYSGPHCPDNLSSSLRGCRLCYS